ncbi:Ger(x)C family spore germination protein [Paenibacillus sp. NPDC056579]|uniref:Ger(x)C family spore germination protein n=1 Tax=Paenibacillus sp. NPDC056579 TaxID=3345871 RepID=UPI0036BBF9E3
MKVIHWILICCLMASCIVKTEVVEDINIALAAAVDEVQPNSDADKTERPEIKITMSVPSYNSDSSISNRFFRNTGASLKDITMKMNYSMDQYLSISKLSLLLISEPVLNSGIMEYASTLFRDPLLSGRLILAMTEGQAEDLFRVDIQSKNVPIGTYLCHVVENNIATFDLPLMNLHQFIYAHKGAGMDPIIPILGIKDNRPLIRGIALMKNGCYVGKLSDEEMIPFSWMKKHRISNSYYTVRLSDKAMSISNIKIRRHYEYSASPDQVVIKLKLTGRLMERSPATPFQSDSELNSEVKKKLAKDCEAIIAKLQKLGVDPLGLGDFVRTHSRDWREEEWKDLYPRLPVKVVLETEFAHNS